MKKRVLSMVLALVMLFAILPLSAFQAIAQEIPVVQTITDVAVTIDEPVAGREASFEASLSSLPTSGVWLYKGDDEYTDYTNGILWYDETAKQSLKKGDCFVLGHEYTLSMYVSVTNPFYYYFSAYANATVNGNIAILTKVTDTRCLVKYNFTTCAKAPADVETVTLGGVLYPVAGRSPVFEVAIDEERTERNPRAGTAFTNGVAWYNSNTYYIMTEDDVFEAGETYTLLISLKAKGNYRFATENDESVVAGTINGIPMKNVTHEDNNDPSRYLKLKYEFTCKEADTVGGGAPIADIRIDYPVNGKQMSYSPTVYGQNCDVRRENIEDKHFYEGVKWTNRTHNFEYSKNSRFKVGSDYSVTVLISAASIMADETRLSYVLLEDGTVIPYIRAYVNGLPARVEPYEDISPAQMVQVTFDFPACNDTALTVDDITFTDLTLPILGKTPDMVATMEFGYVENTANQTKVVDVMWLEWGGRLMTETDTFLEGYQYCAIVELKADVLSTFLMDENKRYGGVVSAYGADEAAADWYPDTLSGRHLLAAAMYTPFAYLPEPFDSVDIIGLIPPAVGQRACYSASLTEALLPYAEITDITWHDAESGGRMSREALFKEGEQYWVSLEITPHLPYSFARDLAFSVNGDSTPLLTDSTHGIHVRWEEDHVDVEVFYPVLTSGGTSGVTDYAEFSDLMRPAPGQTPDFNVSVDSPYTQFGGVTWFELDDEGYMTKALSYNDTFKKYTRYRAEIRVLPTAGRAINLTRGATINNEASMFYYLSGEAAVVYAEYDTADCITTLQIGDIQYPLPGKTPDTNIVFFGGQENLVTAVPYDANDTQIEWYYETNPGTAVAGFSRLDGKFKTDRRHQAYVQIQTLDDAWFATDNEGNLVVDAYFDGVPVDFAYTTDSYLTDGAVNKLEAACTYELAKNADGVFVDGMWLTDGLYLDSNHWGVQTEDTVDKDAGYAYYNDGVLTLHDFVWETRADYDAIASYHPLTVHIEGGNEMITAAVGINTGKALTLTGDKDATLTLMANQYGIFVNNTLTVNSGNWYISADTYDGVWLYSDFTMNDGYFEVYGEMSGIYGDDWPRLTVNGGKLVATSPNDNAIAYCVENFAAGMKVQVSMDICSGAAAWDGVTSLADYAYVSVEKQSGVLLGDVDQNGTVNTRDALRLYQHTSSKMFLTDPAALAAADVDGSGGVNMRDALALFQQVSSR